MKKLISQYMAKIGRKGGRISRRALSHDEALEMVRVREARRAYKKFYARCFWSYSPDMVIGKEKVSWVGERLMKLGGMDAWRAGAALCR